MGDVAQTDDLYKPYPEAQPDAPTWGDYARTAGAGATGGVGAPLAAATARVTDQSQNPTGRFVNAMSKVLQKHLNDTTDSLEENRSDVAKQRAAAAITSPEFWDHPVSAGMLKLTGVTPSVAAMLVSGGPIGVALVGGALGAGTYLNDVDKAIDNASEDQLKENDWYKSLRSSGMSDADARTDLKDKLTKNKALLNFAVGAVAGAIGPAGKLAGVGGVIGEGAVAGAAEGALGGAAQGGVENATVQQTLIDAGVKKEFDKDALVNSVLEPGALGGVMGAAAGAVAGKGKAKANEIKAKAEAPADEPAINPEIKPENVNQAPKDVGTGVQSPPVETAPVGNPKSAPTRSETAYPKAEAAKAASRKKGKVKGPSAEIVDPVAPTTAEAAAIADLQQPTKPTAPEVPLPAPVVEAPKPAPEPTPQAPEPVAAPDVRAPQVTPEVTPVAPPESSVAAAPEPAPAPQPTPEQAGAGFSTPAPAELAASFGATPKKTGRVLQVIKDKAAQEADAKAAKEALKKTNKNAKEVIAAEDGEPVSRGKNRTKAEQEQRANTAKVTQDAFEKHVPEDAQIPTTPSEREALRSRLGDMVKEVDDAGAVIPEKVGYEGTPDHVVYMRAAKDLYKKLGQKSFTGERRTKQISDFLIAERAAKAGDFSVLRETRKVEGDTAMRRDQGNVEERGGTAGAEAEKEPVQTAVAKSARGPVRDSKSEDTKTTGKVLTGEAKAKAIAELNATLAKGKVEAARVDRVEPKKAPTPEATSAKVVDAAGKKTNTEATEGQKEAGNYAKGTVKWHGLEVAIENPKGSVRKGKSPDGSEWSTKMPDHYGYIKRTEGADGDQVDVYMGPNPKSDKVFVVHQRDLHTGEFDEHKAMLGYNNNVDALQAYDRAFSDGRGVERIHDMEQMSADEFKQWVKSDKPKKAAAATKDGEYLDAKLSTPLKSKLEPGKAVESTKVVSAREVLRSLNLSHLSGVPKALAKIAQKRFEALVGDTEVHIVTKEQMAAATGHLETALADSELAGDRGMASMNMADGKVVVLLRADQFKTPEATAHAVLHEIAHAATMRALVEDKPLYDKVTRMMEETESFLKSVPDIREKLAYALTDEREFIAEAFSNPDVQDILSNVPMSPELAREMGMARRSTLWDSIVDTVRRAIEKVTGKIPEGTRMIEGIMRLGPEFDAHINRVKTRKMLGQETRVKPHEAFDSGQVTSKLTDQIKSKIDDIIKESKEKQDQESKPWLMKLRTMDQLAQAGDNFFGRKSNPVRRVADLVEMTRMKAAANLKKSEPIVSKLFELEKKYKASGMWEKFSTLVHDETMANVFADRSLKDNTHLGKDALAGMWGKSRHADLAARYKELPEDLKAARAEAMKFFTDQQNAMSLGIIKNRILKVLGVEDDALARRIHEGRTVDTDADLVGDAHTLDLIKEAKELAKIEGPYFPLMRRGSHVVRAEYEIKAPTNAKKISDNEYEFGSRKEAIDWAQTQDTKPTIKSRWVDKNTGETQFEDGTKVTPQDTDAEQRFRVTVQNQHVEFLDSAKEAQQRAYDLAEQGMAVKGVEERRFEQDRGGDMLSHQMKAMVDGLKRRDGYKDMTPTQKNELVQALHEASLRFLGSTRIQSKRLPRRYVEGASNDLTRNTLEYAQSSAGYLAKLEHQPQLEDALKEMRASVTDDNSKNKSLGRSAIANEIERRVATNDGYSEGGAWNEVTKRMMTVSFLDKLFSPAFNVVNSLQPAMVTMPTLAGRYGVGRSFAALSRAYSDISGFGLVGKGLKDSIAKAKDSQAETTDLLSQIKQNLSAKEKAMIDYLADRGSIDREAGMEIAKLIKSQKGALGKLDAGLGYMEGIARQMPQAIEMMNRAVTALSTYRLEMDRGASHEDAMRMAQENVNNTQGLYSATNAAPIFNHPVAKISFQFKKYGQMMYHLLGSNIGKAMKGATKEERLEAIKTLTGLAATHVAVAGALGLPTEPFKYLLMGANAAGLTNTSWGDIEDKVRQAASDTVGKTAGEVLTKGLPRLLGIDLSSRVGLDSLSSFGEPRSNKESDVKTWMWNTLMGAPVALVGDWAKGMNQLTAGNFSQAAELLVPMKFAADSIKAYRMMTEGKKNANGKQTMTPYSPLEAAARAAGFTPRREAETSAMNSQIYNAQNQAKGDRQNLMSSWVNAAPADKAKAWRAVQQYNVGKPRDAQITMNQLTSAASRAKKNGVGVHATKRDKYIEQRANNTYNP